MEESEYSSEDYDDPMIGNIFFQKYQVVEKLGAGEHAKVYKVEIKEETYAIKIEEKSRGLGLLEGEAVIMDYLKGPYVPAVVTFGFSGPYYVLIMQLLGKTLKDLVRKKKMFTTKTTAMIGIQMLNALQFVHDNHVVHRDVKPENFAMGLNEKNSNLYIFDFGMSKKYRSSKTLEHYPCIQKRKFSGTTRYASIHALEAKEQSRRDDLESVAYILIYFLNGSLPWQGLKTLKRKEKIRKVLQQKKEIPSEELCKYIPKQFREILDYTRSLEFEEDPNYDMLRAYLLIVLKENGDLFDYKYDWTTDADLEERNKKKDEDDDDEEEEEENKINNLNNLKNLENLENLENNEPNKQTDKTETVCCLM